MASTTTRKALSESTGGKAIRTLSIVEIVCAGIMLVLSAVFAFLPGFTEIFEGILGSEASAVLDPHGHNGEGMLVVDAILAFGAMLLFGTALFARDAAEGDPTGGHSYIVMKAITAAICLIGGIAVLVLPFALGSLKMPIAILLIIVAIADIVLAYTASGLGKKLSESVANQTAAIAAAAAAAAGAQSATTTPAPAQTTPDASPDETN